MSKKNQSEYETEVLDFLNRTAAAIAKMFGPTCETLIHDMSKKGHPIVAIYNAETVSRREVGSKADIYGGEITNEKSGGHIKLETDIVNSMVISKTGRHIKSTTIHYKGEGFHYALGINFDYTALRTAQATLAGLTKVEEDLYDQISSNANLQLEDIFDECLALVGKPVDKLKKADRMQLIALLKQRNAFSFQRSIQYVAQQLNVSRYTIYKYCHELEEEA